jgi:CheY-like chemotaxis protein
MLASLAGVLQQALRSSHALSPRAVTLLRSRGVFVIDSNAEQAQYIAYLLSSAGYQPTVVASALDAFTLYLQGAFVPFAIITLQEDANQRFFLNRLSQQLAQKYNWELLFIRLHSQPSNMLSTRTTAPLPPLRTTDRLSSPTTRPLSSAQSPNGIASQTTAPLPRLQGSPGHANQVEEKQISKPLQENVLEKKGERLSLEGENLGRYQVHTLLGAGSQGSVYHSYDRLREQDVALKVIPTSTITYQINEGSTESRNYFQPESELLADVKHTHILPIVHIGKSYVSGHPFFYKTTPYCSEGSLATWSTQHHSKIFNPHEVLNVLLQLAEALQSIHEHGFLYENFKLSNILIKNHAGNMRGFDVGLVDFAFEHGGSSFEKAAVNFRYMAPERFNGQSSPASDQYGLASIVYELLTGRPPFQGNSEQIMKHMHMNMQPQPPSAINTAVTTALNKVVLRALAKRPEDRFASVSEFASVFQKYCN